jgi:hypothetical protein
MIPIAIHTDLIILSSDRKENICAAHKCMPSLRIIIARYSQVIKKST